MKEYNISYSFEHGYRELDEGMVVFTSFLKVLWWIVRHGRRCFDFYVWTSYNHIKPQRRH